MLTVNLYKNNEEFCLEQNKFIQEYLYICPGPLIADGVRSLLGSNAEVVTVAKWVNDQLKENNQKRVTKSELLLRLSSVWRHYFKEAKEQIFFRAFEVFTDLRSFTLDQDLLHDILQELDPDLKKSILLFWVYLENEKLIDEQLAYKLVSADKGTRPLCFVGFKHMNAIQIDMIKMLADMKDVTIAFPQAVYAETLPSDWIRWLLPASNLEYKLIHEGQADVAVVSFQKNKLNFHLKEFRKKHTGFDVVVPSAAVEIIQFQEVLDADLFFKTNIDLFDTERDNVFGELLKQDLSIAKLRAWLTEKKKTSIEMENFRALKVCTMIEECLEIFQEITYTLDAFYISVMNQVVTLNSPRNFLISLNENTNGYVQGLEEHRFKKNSSPVIVVASSLYGSLSPNEKTYSGKILAFLSIIGPLKRAGLDFLFSQETLRKILQCQNSILFLEEGLIDNDLSWRETLKNFELKNLNIDVEYALKKKRDIVKEKTIFKKQAETDLSASRLQSYHDCPRRYYFAYIEKINIRPERRLSLDPDEKGSLEHKIIENYFIKCTEYDYTIHFNLCRTILAEFLEKNRMKISKQLEEETFYELLEYSKNGINFLINYKKNFPAATLSFEVAIHDSGAPMKGFIDCVLKNDNEVHIFDFKRSATSVGSKKDLLSFDKIQLWVYRWALEKKYRVAWWGYVNLSDGSTSGLKNDEVASGNEFQDYLEKLIKRYKDEVEFAPVPRNEKVCHYCELQLFCPKEKVC